MQRALAGRRGLGRRVGRWVAVGSGLDEDFPLVNEQLLIFDTLTLHCQGTTSSLGSTWRFL